MGLNRVIKQLEYKVSDYMYSRSKKTPRKQHLTYVFPHQRKGSMGYHQCILHYYTTYILSTDIIQAIWAFMLKLFI